MMDADDPFAMLQALISILRRVLHGEQRRFSIMRLSSSATNAT